MLTEYEFCVIRRAVDDGHEFFDLSTLSGSRETAQRMADQYDQKSLYWAADNPQVRSIRVRLEEVPLNEGGDE